MYITYILIVPIITESHAAKFFHKRGYAVAGHTAPPHLWAPSSSAQSWV